MNLLNNRKGKTAMQRLGMGQTPIDIRKINSVMTRWYSNTKQNFSKLSRDTLGFVLNYPTCVSLSDDISLCEPSNEVEGGQITLITQFFNGSNNARRNELRTSLKVNTINPHIDKIILLNERIYTENELGVKSDKIQQVVIGKRLEYDDVFNYVREANLEGYIILANLDIFFDKDINILRRTGIANEKGMFCLTRFEYIAGKPVSNSPLFEHWGDSQDTWIWHTNFTPTAKEQKLFNFQLGIPGCDNSFMYHAQYCGYRIYNLPQLIKTYHYHTSNQRNYTHTTPPIPKPYHYVIAKVNDTNVFKQDPSHPFTYYGENKNFYEYLTAKISNNQQFIMPRLTGVETIYGVLGIQGVQKGKYEGREAEILNELRGMMKNNAGILLTDANSVAEYAVSFINTYQKCDAYIDWEPHGGMATSFGGMLELCYEFIYENFYKKRIWAHVSNISNIAAQSKPWTHALAGKRLLIISPFEETIKRQIPNLDKIYGRDMFPDCTFTFLKPPITNGDNPSRPFTEEFNDFAKQIEELASADTFDIALVACGGYGTPILSKIYDMGKSGIYLGGDLQLMFGVYGGRWADEKSAMMRLYKNEYWVRPSAEERPSGFNKIEGGCYW